MSGENTNDIAKLRSEIDRIDAEILKLFEQRLMLMPDILICKLNNNAEVADTEREKEHLQMISRLSCEDFEEYNMELFGSIMKICKKYQYNMLR